MKRGVTAVILLLLAGIAGAREFGWVQVDPLSYTYSTSNLRSSVAVNASGEPARARMVHDTDDGSADLGVYRIDRYDVTGTLLWSVQLQGSVVVNGLKFAPDGALFCWGRYVDTLRVAPDHFLVAGDGSLHDFLLRLTADHQVSWLRDGRDIDPAVSSLRALDVDAAGRIWIGVRYNFLDTAVLRLGPDGATQSVYPQESVRDVSGITVDPDGTAWAVGTTFAGPVSFNGTAAVAPFTYSKYVVKYLPEGTVHWVRFVEDVTFSDLVVAGDGTGHIYFAGPLSADFPFGDLTPEGPDWVYDFFLTRLDAAGNFLWLREVPADGLTGDAGNGKGACIASADSTGVTFVGFFRGSIDWGGGVVPPNQGGADVLVLRYDSDGAFSWVKTAGGPGNDTADAVAVAPQGTVYLAGQVAAGATFDGVAYSSSPVNTFIASLPPEGATGVVPRDPAVLALTCFPNPFNPRTRIAFRLAAPAEVNVAIFDLYGARVADLASGWRPAGEQVVFWNGRDQAGRPAASGRYLCRVTAGGATGAIPLVLVR